MPDEIEIVEVLEVSIVPGGSSTRVRLADGSIRDLTFPPTHMVFEDENGAEIVWPTEERNEHD